MSKGYVHDYESAAAWLKGGKDKSSRPIARNTRVVTTERGLGVRFHSTVVVEYLPDGRYVLNSGGWQTVTTLARLKEHAPALRMSSWVIFHDSDELTAPKVQKCRTCHGTGDIATDCQGAYKRSTWPNGYSAERVYETHPCWHGHMTPHTEHRDCWRCASTGRADYGSKPIGTPFESGVVIDQTGKVVDFMSKPHSTGTAHGFAPGWYNPPATPKHEVDGDTVTSALGHLLPGLKAATTCPVCGNEHAVSGQIVHLNDNHRWSREQVADWLESLDVSLAFPVSA